MVIRKVDRIGSDVSVYPTTLLRQISSNDDAACLVDEMEATRKVRKKTFIERYEEKADNWVDSLHGKDLKKDEDWQKTFDRSVEKFEKLITIKKLNEFLEVPEELKSWDDVLKVVITAPFIAVKNVILLTYNLVKGVVYSFAHPKKAGFFCLQLLLKTTAFLLKPKTWTMVGVGTLGGTLAQAIITGNPFSIVGVMLGCGMIALGLAWGAAESMYYAEKGERLDAAWDTLKDHLKEAPVSFCAGFLMGAMICVTVGPVIPDVGPADDIATNLAGNKGVLLRAIPSPTLGPQSSAFTTGG